MAIPTPPQGNLGIQAPANRAGMTPADTSAWAVLENILIQYGFKGAALTQLVNWARGEIIAGNSSDQVTLDLMQTPQFKQRFPAIGTLASEGIAITPAEYISMEQSYAQAEKAAGITPNFASYDALISNQVSPTEYSDRLTQGYLAVANADQNVVQQFQQYYGVSKAQLAQYFLNPKASEPLLLKQALAAQIGGAAKDVGFTPQISQAESLRLAQQGITQSQAEQGFDAMAKQAQLYGGLPGQPQTYQFTGDKLAAASQGLDATTEQQLQILAQLEKGEFAQGVGVVSNAQGEQGAGSVQR